MTKTVLVTRPQKLAQKTALLLQAKGYVPVILPLTQTTPLPLSADPENFDALIITSTAVFLHAPEERKKIWRRFSLYCVGKTTALYAEKDGFQVAGVAPSAQQLTQKLKEKDLSFLYLAGHIRRPILTDGLQNKIVKIIEVYNTTKCVIDAKTKNALPSYFDAVLFYSAQAAQNSTAICDHFDEKTIAICMAQRIADALPDEFKGKRIISKEPDEDSILNMLNLLCA